MATASQNGCGEALAAACAHRLGVGTVWLGRPWPPGNDAYQAPDDAEITAYLDEAFERLCPPKKAAAAEDAEDDFRTTARSDSPPPPAGLLHLDTATAYGGSEAALQRYFEQREARRGHVVLATKWGGSYEREVEGDAAYILTAAQLRQDVARSVALLGPLDLLYIHMPSSVSPEACLGCLRDGNVGAELQELRHTGKVRWAGASISAAPVLRAALDEGLLDDLDAVQLPVKVVESDPGLWHDLRQRLPKAALVLNSPVRGRGADALSAACRLALEHPHAFLLTGTRTHLADTIDTWMGLEQEAAKVKDA